MVPHATNVQHDVATSRLASLSLGGPDRHSIHAAVGRYAEA